MIRFGRILPPAAAPLSAKDIIFGMIGVCKGESELKRFENELTNYFGMKHSFLVSSGKSALTVTLLALKEISPGRNEVLIPAFTCYSVPSAIVRAGLKVRLCDMAPGTFDFDYDQLSEIISTHKDHLLCVLPVHLFGIPADLERIRKIIADDSVFIVEDAAQAMGAEYKGKKLGTSGDVGFFSLGRGKALSIVDGGVILTNRDDIARHLVKNVNSISGYSASELLALILYSFALFVLSRPSLFWLPKALPFLRLGETIYDPHFKMRKMSSFQAGLAREWKIKLQKFGKVRSENTRELLVGLKRIGIKSSLPNQIPLPYLIRLPLQIESTVQREAIMRTSERNGLGLARTYPDSVDRIPELNADFVSHSFSVAREYAEKLLTLPVHPHVKRKDRDNITGLLAQVDQI